MPSYKLTYFDIRGLAEPARQLFALANVKYEDERLDFKEGWEKKKSKTPFGFLPVLTVDGVEIPESAALTRYLAKKFGYAGKTPEEEAWVDAIVDLTKDLNVAFRQVVEADIKGASVDEKEKIKKDIFLPANDVYLKNLNKLLAKSKSGFLVGDGLTWADLVVADKMTTLTKKGFIKMADHPKLEKHQKKVNAVPALKKWIEKRPDTEF